ncbi:hypothetical protein [Micromonospora inositola]|uniref:hypothetical protein n=1 Tax=Micromonospora inositola TaxID=47865 RepID=UPI0012FE5F4B|nr:hypothetical protein [Micromonospora inositola]
MVFAGGFVVAGTHPCLSGEAVRIVNRLLSMQISAMLIALHLPIADVRHEPIGGRRVDARRTPDGAKAWDLR